MGALREFGLPRSRRGQGPGKDPIGRYGRYVPNGPVVSCDQKRALILTNVLARPFRRHRRAKYEAILKGYGAIDSMRLAF